MKPCYKPMDTTYLVYFYVRHGWQNYIEDLDSYRNFNDHMGQWTLERSGCSKLLGWSLEKPFDEGVLVWHVSLYGMWLQISAFTCPIPPLLPNIKR